MGRCELRPPYIDLQFTLLPSKLELIEKQNLLIGRTQIKLLSCYQYNRVDKYIMAKATKMRLRK
jgi:hypothetical protein